MGCRGFQYLLQRYSASEVSSDGIVMMVNVASVASMRNLVETQDL
jgi:hypothetical protein